MAIEFVGATNASTTAKSVQAAVPGGTQAGDVLVMVIRSWLSLRTSGPFDGVLNDEWTLRLINADRGNDNHLYVFTGVADLADASSPNVQFAANGNHHVNLLAFRGVDPNNPVDAAAQAYSDTGTSNITPSVTTTVPNCMIVRAVASGNSLSSRSFTWPATVDERTDTRSSSGYSYISTATSDSGPSPGPAGTAMATFSTSAYGIMATIALRPKPTSRLHIGSTPAPLMLGSTEVEIKGP
ncbi:hypothetical protein A5N78_04515 [Prescottella equi]|uniref:hypothetical protein n=1 Tax=Rhodococcus hoagii TaxID=43767 RepID=UPI000A1133C1|nr:hypothetical protein [Prescottella equi]ORL93404.1 hypothetical protein A5N78_04515 [Prescottella equi]ORM17757.1 hypothetical protein A5N70_11090 [Prescottella equi]